MRRVLKGHKENNWVYAVAFNPAGGTLASACGDGTLKLWDVGTGEERRTFRGHTGYVTGVAFSPDGRRLVSSSYDCTVKLWRTDADEEPRTLAGHKDRVFAAA